MQPAPVLQVDFAQLIAGYRAWEDFKEIPAFFNEYRDQTILIKGFLYRDKNNHWILASEPNLKSCCLGSPQKIKSQIAVFGDLPMTPPIRAITIQGKLQIADQSANHFYSIRQASVPANTSDHNLYWMETVMVVFFCLASLLFYRTRLPKNKF